MRLLRALCVRRHTYPGVNPEGEIDSGIAKWSKQYANLPERYLLRKTRKITYLSPPNPAFVPGVKMSKIPDFTMERPWTEMYWRSNPMHAAEYRHGCYAEPIRERDWMWFRGDRVEILKGKDKGKQGHINYIVQERNWVTVEGLNCEYKKLGESRDFPGMMYMEETPLDVTTDLKLVDPEDEKATEVEWRFTEDGERVRVSVRSGRILPIPSEAFETVDYKTPAGYAEDEAKDTKAADVQDITYMPKLSTFEMEIMERQGIKEDRVPKKTYFY